MQKRTRTLSLLIFALLCALSVGPQLPTGFSQLAPAVQDLPPELNSAKPEDLLKELRARELRSESLDLSDLLVSQRTEQLVYRPDLRNPKINPLLTKFLTDRLVATLVDKQKIIYGNDDRKDAYKVVGNGQLQRSLDGVLSLFNENRIIPLDDGINSKIVNRTFGTEYRLCSAEPFYTQPCSAFCTGFLVAPDTIATAGHCVNTPEKNSPPLKDIRFVFGYRMRDENNPELLIRNTEIYTAKEIIKRVYTMEGADWALVRLNREVKGHSPLPVRRNAKIADVSDLYVIGHPCGLPAKFADGAIVRNNSNNDFFVANLDTYGGNSGSPVFNKVTNEVEGILVRGETDFASTSFGAPSCQQSLVCPDNGCRGEDCVRTTLFASLIPNN